MWIEDFVPSHIFLLLPRSCINREMFSVYCTMSGSRENINFDEKREAQYC